MAMRVLVAGSREFCAGYRVERAMTRVSANKRVRDMTLVTVARFRRGAERTAEEIAESYGWATEKAETVSQAQADVCLAFLHTQDAHDAPARITAMKAERAGIPVWRYYEGQQQVRPEVDELVNLEDVLLMPVTVRRRGSDAEPQRFDNIEGFLDWAESFVEHGGAA